MESFEDPLEQKLNRLLNDYSAPEVVEALAKVAKRYAEDGAEGQGWLIIESALREALSKIE